MLVSIFTESLFFFSHKEALIRIRKSSILTPTSSDRRLCSSGVICKRSSYTELLTSSGLFFGTNSSFPSESEPLGEYVTSAFLKTALLLAKECSPMPPGFRGLLSTVLTEANRFLSPSISDNSMLIRSSSPLLFSSSTFIE